MRCLLLLIIALLASCTNEPGQKKNDEDGRQLAVQIQQVKQDSPFAEIDTDGSVAWREETPLSFTSPGQIDRVYVNAGDIVRRGQLLASLDSTTVSAALSSAQAEQDRALAEYNRLSRLMNDGWITKSRYEAARAAAEAAKAEVRARRFAIQTAEITARSYGVILARLAEPGQIIAPGVPVLNFGVGASGSVLRISLTDKEAGQIRVGAPATIVFDALKGSIFKGSITSIGSKADLDTGTFVAEIGMAYDPRIRSGLIGRASVTALSARQPLVPPLALFSARADEGFVYVICDDSRARLRKVKLGETVDAGTRIIAGLATGEWVAVSAIDKIRDGMAVSPRKFAL